MAPGDGTTLYGPLTLSLASLRSVALTIFNKKLEKLCRRYPESKTSQTHMIPNFQGFGENKNRIEITMRAKRPPPNMAEYTHVKNFFGWKVYSNRSISNHRNLFYRMALSFHLRELHRWLDVHFITPARESLPIASNLLFTLRTISLLGKRYRPTLIIFGHRYGSLFLSSKTLAC